MAGTKLLTVGGGGVILQPASSIASDITVSIPTGASGNVVVTSSWTISEVAGVLYFSYSGTNKAKLDSSGNLTVVGNVTAYGTI